MDTIWHNTKHSVSLSKSLVPVSTHPVHSLDTIGSVAKNSILHDQGTSVRLKLIFFFNSKTSRML